VEDYLLIKPLIRKALKIFAPPVYWRRRLRGYKISQGELELQIVPYLCSQDQISIDIGAADGAYAIEMAKHSKRCIAFEPRSRQASDLSLLARYGGLPMSVESAALSDTSGTTNMRVLVMDGGRSTIEESNDLTDPDGSPISQLKVETRTLDSYRYENVALVKIDVEGHELSVLGGARDTLVKSQPVVIIETENRHRPNAVASVIKFFADLDYVGYFFLDGSLTPTSEFDAELHQDPSRLGSWKSNWAHYGVYVNNFIFFPQAKKELVRTVEGKVGTKAPSNVMTP
jgi:FkbM family methyltransferase